MRRTFSLVKKDQNFTQLKNQVDKLDLEPVGDITDRLPSAKRYLPKALNQIVNEFETNLQVHQSCRNGSY